MNKILFFAHLKDVVGVEKISEDVSGKTVAQLKNMLVKKYQLPNMDNVLTAINEEFAPNDEIINEGDEIAFIPPVSGG